MTFLELPIYTVSSSKWFALDIYSAVRAILVRGGKMNDHVFKIMFVLVATLLLADRSFSNAHGEFVNGSGADESQETANSQMRPPTGEDSIDSDPTSDLWAMVYSSDGYQDLFRIWPLISGGYIATGVSSDFELGPFSGTVMKIGENGEPIWVRRFPASAWSLLDIVENVDGTFLAVGSSEKSSVRSALLVKFSKDGDIVWQKEYANGDSQSSFVNLIQTKDNKYVAAGRLVGANASDGKVWVVKLHGDGEFIWQRILDIGPTGLNLVITSLIETKNGELVIAGSGYAGGRFGWVLRLSQSGNVIWAKSYRIGDNSGFSNLKEMSDGSLMTIGTFMPSDAFKFDVWVNKLDASGNLFWSKAYGGIGYEEVPSLVTTEDASAIISGVTSSWGAGELDAWLFKVDAQGEILWQKTFGGNGYDHTWDIKPTEDSSYVITGDTAEPSEPPDAMLLKVDHEGNISQTCGMFGESEAIPEPLSPAVQGLNVTDVTGAATVISGSLEWESFSLTPERVCEGVTGGAELSVSHVEVTQGIQDVNNEVPLIAGKPTLVRVYVDCGEGCTAVEDVTGELEIQTASTQLTLTLDNDAITAVHTDWQNQRGELDTTLNFVILPGEVNLAGTTTFTPKLNGESGDPQTFTFEPGENIPIAVLPVRYRHNGIDVSPSPEMAPSGHWWASRVFPVVPQPIVLPEMTWTGSCFGNYCIDDDLREIRVAFFFMRLRAYLELHNMLSDQDADLIYAWWPHTVYRGGTSNAQARTALGGDDPQYYSQTFAHESAHLLGRPHTDSGSQNNCGNPSPGLPSDWPYTTATIQEWGLDLSEYGSALSPLKDPARTYDYMSYCWVPFGPNNEVKGPPWTSPHTFERIYTQSPTSNTIQNSSSYVTEQSYLMISGLVFSNNTASLEPSWMIPSTTVPGNPLAGTDYCVEAQAADGSPLSDYCFDLNFVSSETGETTTVDFFNVMLPYLPGITQVVLEKSGTTLASQVVSQNEPTVTVLTPNGGESWNGESVQTVRWAGSDADGDKLTYNVFYSPDGSRWTPIATNIDESEVEVNTETLAGSEQSRIRVLATDGFHTSEDESDAVFSVERKAPLPFIFSPHDGGNVRPDMPTVLTGTAYDQEDGVLEGNALFWSSNVDGYLGTGEMILARLSHGEHVVSLTAVDSDGSQAVVSVHVSVGHSVYLPSLRR